MGARRDGDERGRLVVVVAMVAATTGSADGRGGASGTVGVTVAAAIVVVVAAIVMAGGGGSASDRPKARKVSSATNRILLHILASGNMLNGSSICTPSSSIPNKKIDCKKLMRGTNSNVNRIWDDLNSRYIAMGTMSSHINKNLAVCLVYIKGIGDV